MPLFPLLPPTMSLAELNEHLLRWVEKDYNQRVHSSTGQKPLERHLKHVSLLRKAPDKLREYFRRPLERKVDKDRSCATSRLHPSEYRLMSVIATTGSMVELLRQICFGVAPMSSR